MGSITAQLQPLEPGAGGCTHRKRDSYFPISIFHIGSQHSALLNLISAINHVPDNYLAIKLRCNGNVVNMATAQQRPDVVHAVLPLSLVSNLLCLYVNVMSWLATQWSHDRVMMS